MSETEYTIIDRGFFAADKEYVDKGIREGWLVLHRIKSNKGKSELQYRYLE